MANSVRDVAKFMHAPSQEHWKAVLRVLQYLKATKTYGVTYSATNDGDLQVFADADFARDPDDRRSISGGAVIYGGAAVSWFSRAQSCTAMSSTEAEYVALSDVVKEAEFVRGILRFLEPQQ